MPPGRDIYRSEDEGCDEYDDLVDTDPLELRDRCRQAEYELTGLRSIPLVTLRRLVDKARVAPLFEESRQLVAEAHLELAALELVLKEG